MPTKRSSLPAVEVPPKPSRGEVWWVDLDPVTGHEQAGKHPALIFSSDRLNRGRGEIVWVVPMTTTDRGIRSHVAISPPDGGVSRRSFAMAEQLRAISTERLRGRVGRVSAMTLAQVADVVRMMADL